MYSSMALRDDLESQESYYIVEIKSLKRILDQIGAKDRGDVLCFVDEVLRGTNTVERIAASSQVLRYMTGPGAVSYTHLDVYKRQCQRRRIEWKFRNCTAKYRPERMCVTI